MSDSDDENPYPEVDELGFLAEQIVEVLKIDDIEESASSHRSDKLLSDGSVNFQARSYQKEMLEESIKRNIIVAVSPKEIIFTHSSALWLGCTQTKMSRSVAFSGGITRCAGILLERTWALGVVGLHFQRWRSLAGLGWWW